MVGGVGSSDRKRSPRSMPASASQKARWESRLSCEATVSCPAIEKNAAPMMPIAKTRIITTARTYPASPDLDSVVCFIAPHPPQLS